MSYQIFPTLSTLEFELRQHPQWPLALLDLEGYLVLEPENDEAERLLDAMEEHANLPRTYSWISGNGRKERLYLRPRGLESRRLVVGDARLVFRTGSCSYPVAASPAKSEDYANTGDPSMLIAKPAWFPKKAPPADRDHGAVAGSHVLTRFSQVTLQGSGAPPKRPPVSFFLPSA